MAKPRVLVLRSPGTNCDEETAFAFEKAGGLPERIHINRLVEKPNTIEDFQILCVPGGFSYGDDIAAGRILANQMASTLQSCLEEFRAQGKLILGICNGFQVLIKTGLLIDESEHGFSATLTWNRHGQYEDRWVDLQSIESPCVFTDGIDRMYLPVAHAEGRFAVRDQTVYEQLFGNGQLALRYATPGNANGQVPFPYNPNGSVGNVAGVCDPTGRVFGLMPHPERFIDRTHHPHWTRLSDDLPADGIRIFENSVRYFG